MNLFKFKSRKNNTSQKKISLILVITVLFTFLNFKINDVNADTAKEIRVLEIQSSQSYVLTSNSNVNGYKVTVDQVGMPEFISRVDQLNGKYDVIVIGNNGNDYTNPFSSKPEYIYHNEDIKENGIDNHIEYYSENDITNKRAEEIKDMINSGQLVYMESSILSGSSLKNTKLYSNFENIKNSNFKKVSVSNLKLKTIVDDYNKLSFESKRPIFELTKTPSGDSENNISLENRNMIFQGKITPSNSNEKLVVNLYIDINGDSLFRESDKELVGTTEVNITNNKEAEFKLEYTTTSDFVGQLNWKVEVERVTQYESNAKSYKIGTVKYKPINGKKPKINVLQIYLNEASKLEKNSYFNDIIKFKCNDLHEQIDYEIILNYRQLSNFNKEIENGTLNLDSFDMIILGFDNSFYNNSLSDKASEAIKEFIKTGQSVMFTHDNISLNYNNHITTQEFRDILGQSRFTDLQYNSEGNDLFGNEIKHDTELESKLGDKWTMGYTKGHLDRYKTGKSNLNYSTSILEINSGLISQYPFKFDTKNITVQRTHGQYYQLNLEHPDLVPWYVFNDSYYNNNDARNNYYTYSIGNLTYSGTGHLNDLGSYGKDEIMLFVNTIVKASRGANNAPTIDALSDQTTEVSNTSEFNFNAVIRDFNEDKVKITEVIVGGTLDSSTGAIQNGTGQNIWNTEGEEYYDSGSSFDITIPKNIIEQNSGKETNVTIKAIDDRGASSEKTYQIKPVSDPILRVYDYKFVGLAGQESTIYMSMEKQNNDNSSKNIYDIKAQIEANNFIDVSEIKVDESTNKIKVKFKTKGIIDGQAVDLKVNYKVENELKSTTAKIILYTKDLNELPNIKVNLTSEKIVNYLAGDVEVKYEIIPEDFEYIGNSNNAENKEVVFVIDTSKDMEYLGKVQNALINRMINHFLNGNNKNIKFNIVTYNSEINEYIIDPNTQDYRNALQNEIQKISQSSNEEKKLGEAIKRADEIFTTNGDKNSLKNIVIIAAGDPTDTLPSINGNKYNIITLALNKVDNYNNTEENYKNPYEKLNNWHTLLGGNENNYFVSAKRSDHNDIEGGTDISNKNPLAPNGDIMSVIANRIKSLKNTSYIFNDVKLNFNLDSNFNAISGLQIENDSNYSIRLPQIIYKPIEQIDDNYYRYKADPIEISFKIKPKDGKIGELNFAKNSTLLKNYISYTTLGNEIRKEGIVTPSVIVKEQIKNINHGLYNGINKGQVSIQENNNGKPFEIAQGSTVTFGAKFTFSISTDFKLNVDKNIQGVDKDNIKIYKILNGVLEEVKIEDKKISGENNEFSLSINGGNNTEILVIYQGKIIDRIESGQTLTNDIVFGSTSKKVTIVTPQQSNNSPILPDLF